MRSILRSFYGELTADLDQKRKSSTVKHSTVFACIFHPCLHIASMRREGHRINCSFWVAAQSILTTPKVGQLNTSSGPKYFKLEIQTFLIFRLILAAVVLYSIYSVTATSSVKARIHQIKTLRL